MAETRDYTKLLPPQPPESALEWCKQTLFAKEYGIYRDTYYQDERTGREKNGVQVTCTACGHAWNAVKIHGGECRYNSAPFGFADERSGVARGHGEKFNCPSCGYMLTAMHVGQISKCGIDDNVYFMTHTQIDGNFALQAWRAERNTGKDASKVYRMWPYEAYVFESRKAIQLTGYQKYMTQLRLFDGWKQIKKCTDVWGPTRRKQWYHRPRLEDITGTTVEKSGLIQYLTAAGDEAMPVAYLRLWQKHRNLENLVIQGCGKLVADEISEEKARWSYGGTVKLEWIDWKKKRPSAMLGLNRDEFSHCTAEQWTKTWLENYKMIRAGEPVDLLTDMPMIKRHTTWNLEKLMKERGKLTVMRCLRYLERQGMDIQMLLDYWSMAARAGMDLDDAHVRLPKSLKREHDRLMEAERIARNAEEKRRKQAEIEKRRPAFEKTVAAVADWAWEADGICIRPVKTEEELMDEGTALHHCVGDYGPKVARGESCIFFIRRAAEPDKSWYTLQVGIKGICEIQNHGLRNCPPTKEVQAFVDKWLDHVRQLVAAGKKKKKGSAA